MQAIMASAQEHFIGVKIGVTKMRLKGSKKASRIMGKTRLFMFGPRTRTGAQMSANPALGDVRMMIFADQGEETGVEDPADPTGR